MFLRLLNIYCYQFHFTSRNEHTMIVEFIQYFIMKVWSDEWRGGGSGGVADPGDFGEGVVGDRLGSRLRP